MSHKAFNITLFVIYMLAMTLIMLWQGIGIAPDRYALILLLGALLVKKTRSFLLDWIPFLFILISYDFLRGFADDLSHRVHFQEMINADRFMFFGQLPGVVLQQLLYNSNHLHWYDYMATFFYFVHFSLPLSFGFILWVYNRSYFKQFVTAITSLSYAAWVTYIIFPAAPPWMANNQGYISGISKVMDQTFKAFPDKWHVPTIYQQFDPNPVAAIPSLHAAYPFLVLLFCINLFGKKGLLFLPYVLGVWWSIVYSGEHYVIDVILGAIYAAAFYMLAKQLHHNVKFQNSLTSLINKPKRLLVKEK